MREKEVKEKIGKGNWDAFNRWMAGQTVGIYPDGSTNFYNHDVETFLTKLKTSYDRQDNPLTWD